MNRSGIYILLVIAVLVSVVGICRPGLSSAEEAAALSTGITDQTGVSVTIYNVNLGLVKEQRMLNLPRGTTELKFMDVASQIIPKSVQMKSLNAPDSLRILEQNYEYDLLNPKKLLDKYVGKEVKLFEKNPYTEKEDTVSAILLSNNEGPIFKIDGSVTFNYPGRVILPGIPENLISKPTLVWLLSNDLQSPQKIETSYLTNGITWMADYVVTLNAGDDQADLSGWVTIDNRSGATYKNAKLKLVAGDVNRIKEEPQYKDKLMRVAAMEARQAAPQFKEEGFFEYHIYTLQRPSTIKENQTKQISLLTAVNVPAKKEFVYSGAPYYYHNRYGEISSRDKISVFMQFENREKHNLGMPLPKGTVRVYKYDSEGSLQFIGEDSIDHTPKDEKIRIKLGDAFDVVGSRKQMDWEKISSDTYEAAFEITIRNHKKENITVKVVEPVPGDWSMLQSSLPHRKTDAFTAEFDVPVPADGEMKLTYRVRMKL